MDDPEKEGHSVIGDKEYISGGGRPMQIASNEKGDTPYEVISNLHGSHGTFPSRQQAFNYARQMGIPTNGSGLTGGYKLKKIAIPGKS